MEKLLIATKNAGKLGEFKKLLGEKYEIFGLPYDEYSGEVEENGETFYENALIKARDCFEHTGVLSLADDSGLCVDALGGRPGVFTARYGGDISQREKNAMLIAELSGSENRRASFKCALVAYGKNGVKATALGEAFGSITYFEQGEGGFGYDGIFYSDELKKTFAEATEEEKNVVSHRARAVLKIAELL